MHIYLVLLQLLDFIFLATIDFGIILKVFIFTR